MGNQADFETLMAFKFFSTHILISAKVTWSYKIAINLDEQFYANFLIISSSFFYK